MLTKILFTLGVMVLVGLIFRTNNSNNQNQTRRGRGSNSGEKTADDENGGPSNATIAYAIVGFVLLASVFFFYLGYKDNHIIMDIRVTNPGNGEVVVYQAYKQDIDGRKFTTLDGREVTIGSAERFEVTTH